METADKRILDFISSNKLLTLATCEGSEPWCAMCFYAFLPAEHVLVFMSDMQSKHVQQAILNSRVAGTIPGDKLDVTHIKGVQFTGSMKPPGKSLLPRVKKTYYSRFPLSRAFAKPFWIVELDSVKMTDNTLGFGSKIRWNRTGGVTSTVNP